MFDIEEISIPMEQKLNELEDEICAWIDAQNISSEEQWNELNKSIINNVGWTVLQDLLLSQIEIKWNDWKDEQ
tara:strand:+ start:4491 stop:4709 length:219 start_codon:yes stop_codon:yes gene_type:complete